MKLRLIAAAAAVLCLAAPAAHAADPGPRPVKHHFSLGGKSKTYHQRADPVVSEVDLSAEDTEGRYTFLDEIWNPGFKVSPHFHKTHAETFYIVSGQVEWTVGGETHVMGAGDLVFIPPNTVHSVHVVGDKPAHSLMIYDPGGYEEILERQDKYTPAQLETPELKAQLRALGDFNPATPKP